ncbi:MAG: flagellar hook-basal body complex protein FliE [Oscillospiraceae bacterium]|nr:flagellar hook-basal body complex protein FliE [Oscillospiraceae bacterium]
MVYFTPIEPLGRMERMDRMESMNAANTAIDTSQASFADVFRGLVNNVVETNEQVDRDAIDVMLGNVDDLATVQANIEKANMAVDVLVSVKNEVLSAYNSIINMQI